MQKYKIGIIGATGFATEKMLPQLQYSTTCEVIAILGRNEEKIKQVAKEFGVKNSFTDLNEMLQANIYDLVYIATPPYLHLKDIKTCLESGRVKNILCEKPIVLTADELTELSELASQYPTVNIFVGHHIRHQKSMKDLKQLLEEKTIGDIISAEGSWGYMLDPNAPYAVWKLDQAKGGTSVMGDPGIHIIDIMFALFGAPNNIQTTGTSDVHKTTIDNVTATFEYENMRATVHASQTALNPKNDLIIIGTNGRIEIPNCFSQTYIPEIHIVTARGTEIKSYEETFLYKNEVENILGMYTDGLPATNLQEGITETKTLLDINEQVVKG